MIIKTSYPFMKPPPSARLIRGHRLAQGLVGYWLFNEGSGNKVFDLSGNGITGTLSSMPWVPGISGSAIKSNTGTDYCDLGNPGILNGATEATVIMRIKMTNLAGDSDLFVIGEHNFGAPFLTWMDDASPDHWAVIIGSAGVFYSNAIPVVDTWYHLAFVYRGGIDLRLFIDAIEDIGNGFPGSIAGEATIGDDTYTIANQKIHSGKGARALFDHVMLYNRALNASEIAELYEKPFGMFERKTRTALMSGYEVVAPPVGMAGAMTTNTGYWGY